MMVLVAICLPLCLIMAAFAVNVAWMQLTRTELRTATDSAARAGAKSLSLFQDQAAAIAGAKAAAKRNEVAGSGLAINDADVEVGISKQSVSTSRFVFTPGGTQLNAVRVTGRRTKGSAAGAVNLLFSGVMSVKVFQPVESATATQLDRDICLVLDRSGSMAEAAEAKKGGKKPAACAPPDAASRWADLQFAVGQFLNELDKSPQTEAVAMASYGSDMKACGITYHVSDINSDLVTDYTPIRSELARIGNNPINGRTNISAGLDDGVKVLTGSRARKFAVKTMILMTDGLQNEGRPALQAAQDAAKKNITIHTITFSDDADQQGMIKVAQAAGGQHFHAPNREELTAIFKEIAATLPVLTTN
jgi:Ca-activated chloride channel homolog